MGLIKRDTAERTFGNAVTLDLADVAREAEKLRAKAREDAARIVEEAEAERRRLVETAEQEGREAGYQAGHAVGLEAGRSEGHEAAHSEQSERLERLAAGWEEALGALERDAESLVLSARRDIVRLAAGIVETIAKRTVEFDETAVARVVEEALRGVVEPGRAVVRVSPADFDFVGQVLPEILGRLRASGHATVESDETLSSGSVIVSSPGGGFVDATVETRIERLVRVLQPAVERRRSDSTVPLESADGAADADADDDESVGELAA